MARAIGSGNIDDDVRDLTELGATIHDIGKIYVPAVFLNRPGKLSDAEVDIIKCHPEVCYQGIRDVRPD